MTILEKVSKPLARTTPDVWVSRLAIFGKLTEAPIRDITLKTGLNIVWAEEPDDEDDKRDVAGHSAGKTTFCRLLRYVLGEKTFASKSNTGLIKGLFPNGYVGAEIFVKGIKWAVLRPLGENRASYVLKDVTVEQLIEKRGESAFQETYPEKIGLDAILDRLQSSTVVRTDNPIKWGHLLAWCTRDQEARFQNIYDWRSPRSESEWPTFRFPKADPLFVMRVVLGLFLADELEGEERLSQLQQALENAEKALEVAKKEPLYWREHYDQTVRQQLQKVLPDDHVQIADAPILTDEVLPDLKRFTSKAKYLLVEQIQELEELAKTLQDEINALNETMAADRVELQQLNALFKLESTAEGEATAGLKRDEEIRKRTAENKNKTCPYGDILIGRCTYVSDRQELLNRSVIKDSHTLEQMEAARAAEVAKIAAQQQNLGLGIRTNEQKRDNLTEQKNKLIVAADQKRTLQITLDTNLASLLSWKERLDAPNKYEKLQAQIKIIEDLQTQVKAKQAGLNQRITKHDDDRELLNTIFSTAAKQVLPSAKYDGVANLVDRELHFQITHGGTMTGEAMETLAVLLADLSCLIYTAFSSESHMPGFLLHDSPREADLGLRLYKGYLRYAAQVAYEFEAQGGCPFQYIITKTTPPPKALINDTHVALRLDASSEPGLLFRRDLSRQPEEDQLHLI